jgi:hypothetical protein
MSFVSIGGGVSKLSQLTIDADKDWQVKGISNLKELAAGMVQGDLLVKGAGGVLVRLPPGVANLVLTSAGPGAIPTWAPGGTFYNRYFPATIVVAYSATKNVSRTYTKSKTVAMATAYVDVLSDVPASMVKMNAPVVSSLQTAIKNVSRTYSAGKSSACASSYDYALLVDGAVRDYGGTMTTETTAAQNTTVNDINLMRASPVTDDAYYFGLNRKWDYLSLDIGTNGVGSWGWTWEYYNGVWVSLTGVTDGTNGFTAGTGVKTLTFTRPGDWTTIDVNSVGSMYWIRARLTSYTSKTTTPVGTRAVCGFYS